MDIRAKKLVSLCGLPGKSFLQNLFTVWAREAQIGVGEGDKAQAAARRDVRNAHKRLRPRFSFALFVLTNRLRIRLAGFQ